MRCQCPSRVKDAPRRPPNGWGLLVKPLGVGKGTSAGDDIDAPAPKVPFVAQPDGTRRPLNADERDMQDAARVKPRRKLT